MKISVRVKGEWFAVPVPEFAYKEPAIVPSEVAQISFWDRALNLDVAQAFGRMFSGVKTLIIYWDTDDCVVMIDNLVSLLSNFAESKELNTFGLIFSGNLINDSTVTKICTAINTHLAPLKQLHLMLPCLVRRRQEVQGENPPVGIQPPFDLNKAVESATNFSLTGNVNIDCYVRMLGSGFCQKQSGASSSEDHQLESLCIPFSRELIRIPILNALELNKDKFVGVRRLLVLNVMTVGSVKKLLKYFPNLEQLCLTFSEPSYVAFGLAWIRALKPLTKLSELTLFNFRFERKPLGWGRHSAVDETVNLNQLRKLTFTSLQLFICLREDSNPLPFSQFIPQLQPQDIADTISMRFPGLQELSMWSGDAELHETAEVTWQALEQNLNREVPLRLALLPGLRVNIQLRHPAMYKHFLDQDVQDLALNRTKLAASNAYRLNRARFVNLIERRPYLADLTDRDRALLGRRYSVQFYYQIQDLPARAEDNPPAAHRMHAASFDLLPPQRQVRAADANVGPPIEAAGDIFGRVQVRAADGNVGPPIAAAVEVCRSYNEYKLQAEFS